MPAAVRSWPLSSALLALAGVSLVGAGLYISLLRLPSLPDGGGTAWRPHGAPGGMINHGSLGMDGLLLATLTGSSFRTHHWAASLRPDRCRRLHRLDHHLLGLQMQLVGHACAVRSELGSLLVRKPGPKSLAFIANDRKHQKSGNRT